MRPAPPCARSCGRRRTRARARPGSRRRWARAGPAPRRTARSIPRRSGPSPTNSLRPVSANPGAPDVAIIGGGIVGCALAAFLAEDGASVCLYERDELAAGASGRNSGLLQHPLDEALAGVYAASLAHYGELGHGFSLPREPVGVLVLGADPAALEPARAAVAARFPELRAEALDAAALRAAEPALADGLAGYRLATGRPVPPASATRAFAARARSAGARIEEGAAATPVLTRGRATGVRPPAGGGARRAAGAHARPRARGAHAGGRVARRGGGRRRRAVDLRARRPGRRVAADHAGLGRRRRAPAGAAAPPGGRGGRGRGAAEPGRRAGRALQPRHPRGRLGARIHVPARAARPGGARAGPDRAGPPLPAGAGPHASRVLPRLPAAHERRRAPAARAAAGERAPVRGERARPVGRLARAGIGPARRRRGARAAGRDRARARRRTLRPGRRGLMRLSPAPVTSSRAGRHNHGVAASDTTAAGPTGLAHVATVSFLAARAAPPAQFWLGPPGGGGAAAGAAGGGGGGGD